MRKCNSFNLVVGQVMVDLQRYYMAVLEKESEKLIEIMEKEIYVTTYGGAPGRTAWKDELKKSLMVVHRSVTEDAIEFGVGASFTNKTSTMIARMIITNGSGSLAGRQAIHEKPGKTVLDKNLNWHKSKAKFTEGYVRLLPAEFNQRGNKWLKNSMKLIEKHFMNTLEKANAELPSTIFSNALIVGGGG